MNIKKIIIVAAIFISTLVLAVLVLFPYTKIVKTTLDDLLGNYGLAATYTNLSAGPFGIHMEGAEIITQNKEKYFVGDIKVSYSPLTLLTRKVAAVFDTPYGVADIKYSHMKFIDLTADIDIERIAKLLKQSVKNGRADLIINYNFADKKGTYSLNSSAFVITSPLPVSFSKATSNGPINDTTITVANFSAEGDGNAKFSGQIKFDIQNIMRSYLNISGDVNVMGMVTRLSLGGPFNDIRLRMN